MKKYIPLLTLIITLFSHTIYSQTTEFTYQGHLLNGTLAADGNYDFEFSLFSAQTGGDQISSTIEITNVSVTKGVFTVRLDFGDVFQSGNRFLGIRVKPAGGSSYTDLNPRQPITSMPFAQKSLRADQATTAIDSSNLGGNPPSAYTLTTDPRLSDARNPLPGSTNYIQNTFTQQTGATFNISGTGTANIFNAGTQFNIGNSRVLSIAGTRNVFLGVNSGPGNTGQNNTFVGFQSGLDATSGSNGSFFGFNAGLRNTEGLNNTFVGVSAGSGNLTGDNNAFFGFNAGLNSTGSNNTFIGYEAGIDTTSEGNNTAIGYQAKVNSGVSNSIAIGAGAVATGNDQIVIGTRSQTIILPRFVNIVGANSYTTIEGIIDAVEASLISGSVTSGSVTTGVLIVNNTSGEASEPLCRNFSNNFVRDCSSSIRYKKNVGEFRPGLELIKKLRPVRFEWKESDKPDIGLIAEEVSEIEPLLTTRNNNGEIQGVKYDRVGVIAVNAIMEQQEQIESQQEQIEWQTQIIERQTEKLNRQAEKINRQEKELAALKALVCSQNQTAELCAEKEVGNY